jgi:hypothetical protein
MGYTEKHAQAEFYSRLHRGLVETRSRLLGRTTTESKSREFGQAFVSDRNSGDAGLVGYGAIGKVDCHDRRSEMSR